MERLSKSQFKFSTFNFERLNSDVRQKFDTLYTASKLSARFDEPLYWYLVSFKLGTCNLLFLILNIEKHVVACLNKL